jgi:hypothetical protein
MNTTLCTGRSRARQRNLGHDLGAAELARETALPRHAEHAADGAADLRRHAQAAARQQHAFDRLAVGQADQQARRAVGGRVLGAQGRQAGQFIDQGRQGLAQGLGQVMLDPPAPAVLRPRLRPASQHMRGVAGAGAQAGQSLSELLELHRRRGRRKASGQAGSIDASDRFSGPPIRTARATRALLAKR